MATELPTSVSGLQDFLQAVGDSGRRLIAVSICCLPNSLKNPTLYLICIYSQCETAHTGVSSPSTMRQTCSLGA